MAKLYLAEVCKHMQDNGDPMLNRGVHGTPLLSM
jgi:hypothetical protein